MYFFKKMTLSYEKKNGSLIIFCDWEKHEDFLISLNAVKNKIDGKECFIFPLEKEKELIKMINYLNMINNAKPKNSQNKYHREDSEDEKEGKKTNRIEFFKSFGEKDFKKKQVKKTSSSSSDEDDDDDGDDKEEYSSSSYDSSSSDNFPSPKTPKRRSNYSNEQLYFMIEKMQRKIGLIERILEKKLLK